MANVYPKDQTTTLSLTAQLQERIGCRVNIYGKGGPPYACSAERDQSSDPQSVGGQADTCGLK